MDGTGRGRVWIDERPAQPDWPAPQIDGDELDSGDRGSDPRRSKWVIRGVPVLVIVGVLVAVWALGGFDNREDRITTVRPGEHFTNGAYTLTLDKATMQRKKGYGDDPYVQEVVVHGTAKNIWTETASPRGAWFVATDDERKVIKEGKLVSIEYGEDAPINTPDDLTPGLAAMPITIDFDFPDKFDPGSSILVAMTGIDYRNHSVMTSSDEETWDPSNKGNFRAQLPIAVLPADDKY